MRVSASSGFFTRREVVGRGAILISFAALAPAAAAQVPLPLMSTEMTAHRAANFRALLDALGSSPTSWVEPSYIENFQRQFIERYATATEWYRTQVDVVIDALDEAGGGDFSVLSRADRLGALRRGRDDRRSTAYWDNSLGARVDTAISLASAPFAGPGDRTLAADIPI
jgi:hypothetical protein